MLVLLTGQNNLKPDSRRAWEVQSKVSPSKAQSRDKEGGEWTEQEFICDIRLV